MALRYHFLNEERHCGALAKRATRNSEIIRQKIPGSRLARHQMLNAPQQ
jgi:hypothetical protein